MRGSEFEIPRAVGRVGATSLSLFLVACGNRLLELRPVRLDRVTCARCRMVVSREADSAEWLAAGEESHFFDDIGCLATDDPPSSGRSARFVHVGGAGWAGSPTMEAEIATTCCSSSREILIASALRTLE